MSFLHSVLQGSVVDSVSNASHVIYPAPPPSQSADDFFRPVSVKGRNATVHWWFSPDRWGGSREVVTEVRGGGKE